MDVDDNFYDEISSFIRQPDDYTLNDLDEIISSTVSRLDSSLDFDTLVKSEFGLSHSSNDANTLSTDQHDFSNFNFSTFSSPSTTYTSATSPFTTERSSVDGDFFNPDEFMNFLNDDDIKLEELSPQYFMEENMKQRDTPSPTGSCSSSGGSSTSGVQSDASSVMDSKALFDQDIESGMISSVSPCPLTNASTTTHLMHVDDIKPPPTIQTSIASPTTTSSFVPITVPVLPLATSQAPAEITKPASIVRPIQQVTPLNIVQGTIIPFQNVSLATVSSPALTTNSSTNINKSTTVPIKIEPKIAPKTSTPAATSQPVKIVTASATNTTATANNSNSKITPPPNSKPKTIFLSSNDFKALMQKMNANGKNASKTPGVVNGQLPKIIMKAPNGKIITTTKVATPIAATSLSSASASPSVPTNGTPKIIKTNNGPLFIKQQMNSSTKFVTNSRAAAINHLKQNAAAGSSPNNSVSGSGSSVPDLSIYKGIMDEKMLKKQQRMIKNRESASLSRKKKKEYVMSLENRISCLEKENSTLKGENTSLRSQLMAFAQSCHCKNGNVSEFVLNSLNIKVNGEHQHVKIAPKPAPKSIRQKMTAANMKKNVAVLFAMAFMVTMNVGNFQNYLNKNNLENAIIENGGEEALASNTAANSGSVRRLLWVPTETEFNKQLNQSKRPELEMDTPPPLHFLKPINRSNNSRRIDEQQQTNAKGDEPPLLKKCCTSNRRNQTEEYLRLATNLHKWIDGNDYLNLSMPYDKYDMDSDTDTGNDDDKPGQFKMSNDLFDVKPMLIPGTNGKRKFYLNPETKFGAKQRKLDLANDMDNDLVDDKSALDLFKPKISDEYLRLFRGIKRQDDTFYVLSFNMDHILLPASAYNKSARPKMSLMLPAGDPSMNGDIVLMQIDCEVINTTELALKSEMIPEKLRPQKFTSSATPAPQPNDVANNETGSQSKVKENHDLKANLVASKEKPTVRTYVLVGPKTQEAAEAAKKQPTIVRISPSDSRFLNVKNSTLISKIKSEHNLDEYLDP